MMHIMAAALGSCNLSCTRVELSLSPSWWAFRRCFSPAFGFPRSSLAVSFPAADTGSPVPEQPFTKRCFNKLFISVEALLEVQWNGSVRSSAP